MPQSTLYWIIGIIVLLLLIVLIVWAVRGRRKDEDLIIPERGGQTPRPVDLAAEKPQKPGHSPAATPSLAPFDVKDVDRRAAEERREDDAAGRDEAATKDAVTKDGLKDGLKDGAVKQDGAGVDLRPAETVKAGAAAGAATVGLAAAGVAGGTGVQVDDAASGANVPAPAAKDGAAQDSEHKDAAKDAERRPAGREAKDSRVSPTVKTASSASASVPGVAGGSGVSVGSAPAAEDTAKDEQKAEAVKAEPKAETTTSPAAPAADAVPGTVPLKGEDAVIEAPEHAHEQPEAVIGTPAYIENSTTGQDPTAGLSEGEVYGTTPLKGVDAVVEPAQHGDDVSRTSGAAGAVAGGAAVIGAGAAATAATRSDRRDEEFRKADERAAQQRTAPEATATTQRAAEPAQGHTAMPGVAGGDHVSVDTAASAERSTAPAPSGDSVAPTGQGFAQGDRVAPVAGRPAGTPRVEDTPATRGETAPTAGRPGRSRFERIKETVVQTAGTVKEKAGPAARTAKEKAAPAARSAANTVGKAAGTAANTVKDKLAERRRRSGK